VGFFNSGGLGNKRSATDTVSQQSGFSEIGGNATSANLSVEVGKKGTAVFQMLDGGAVMGSLDLAREALAQVVAVQKGANDAVTSQAAQAYQLANQARQSETSGAINNFLKYGAIVLGLALGAWALVKSK
jgi:hypothetical protein